MDKWKCIKSFSVSVCDENKIEDEWEEKQVELGSEWIWDKDGFTSFSEFRLENDSDWLEVGEETFVNCFEKLEGSF